ncbi:MAG: cell wall hydrolase [Lysobacteraceae bacterium]|uniref:cell wall hydrolase n=1 Tax=Denitratimonas sp. CY0512 TaxID=3131940 RepID=UPI0016AC6990|nr:cell wall hydrolase [Gammaproteobacteria bacterium]
MKLAVVLWLAQIMPQPYADQVCLATTVYLEARNQSELGQRAVAEVALRRLDSGRWGDSLCDVVTAPKQFAPTLVSPQYDMDNLRAWERAVAITLDVQQDWQKPHAQRSLVVPGADHFVVRALASPAWAQGAPVATIGDHTFYKVVSRL